MCYVFAVRSDVSRQGVVRTQDVGAVPPCGNHTAQSRGTAPGSQQRWQLPYQEQRDYQGGIYPLSVVSINIY